jgi:hypothetical protein
MKALLESKKSMGDQCKEAFFLMAEAKYAAGEFQYFSVNSGAKSQRQ